MLRVIRANQAAVQRLEEAARDAEPSSPTLLTLGHGLTGPIPLGFAHDFLRTELGRGETLFHAGCNALRNWDQFDLGWVRVANGRPSIVPGELVAVEAHTAFFWSINFSRITEVADPVCFGFLYTTTRMHVEEGQERFVIEYDAASGRVFYVTDAVSRPRHPLARIGYRFSRAMQRRFARDSHRRMRESVTQRATQR
jgi:uncharacterized protein (UPF0548 family)